MKYLFLVLGFLIFAAPLAHAQRQYDNWIFGEHAGVTFKTNPPSAVLTGATNDWEGVASISDPTTGDLLFYTNGETVWNRNNMPMPTGTGLFGNTSSEQSALVIRSLTDTLIYYLFTVDQAGYLFPSRGFNYSIIDMRLDNGLGDVRCKNIHVLDSTGEGLSAIPRPDGESYWIIVHTLHTNTFYAFVLDANGLSSTAVQSNAGASIGTGDYGICGIVPSPDGTHIAFSSIGIPLLQLCNFDASNGRVFNPIILPSSTLQCYLPAFSPNSKLLYINAAAFPDFVIGQFDISSGDSGTIANSRAMIGRGHFGEALMLAGDGKIYQAGGRYQWLSMIEHPNVRGGVINFIEQAIDLKSGSGLDGLPNIPSPLLGRNWLSSTSTQNTLRIQKFFNDTVGGDFYLSIHISRTDTSNPYHVTLSWIPDTMKYLGAYSESMLPLLSSVYLRKGGLTLYADRTSFDTTIIIDFAPSYTKDVTISLDSIPSVIIPNCFLGLRSERATAPTTCGKQALLDFMLYEKMPKFNVSPNPARNVLQISVSHYRSRLQYELFDALGINIKEGILPDIGVKVDVSDLTTGNYYLRMSGAGIMSSTKRIVINR